MDQRILDSARAFLSRGHTPESIKQILINQGYGAADVAQAIQQAMQKGPIIPPPSAKSKIIKTVLLIIFVVSLLSLMVALYHEATKAICGDKVVGDGETSETCCRDAGCGTGLVCRQNVCVATTGS